MYTIAVDAMGGDNAPEITVQGSLSALRASDGIRILLIGQEERITPLLSDSQDVLSRLTVVDARETIETTESPVMAIRKKTDSSLVRGFQAVREGQADALVSAGSTGAVMAGALFRLGRVQGIDRPALATLLPTVTGKPTLLVDVGANVDCQSEWLVQFARMGHVYMEQVAGVRNPRIALLSNGEEDEKGNQQVKDANKLLRATDLNFIGNLEARGVPMGETDVIVADGFAGNILLKSMEGIASAIFKLLKKEISATFRAKIGYLLARDAFANLKHSLDADEVGGAPLLGTQGAVVKAHGNSNAHAFSRAIMQAQTMLDGRVSEVLGKQLERA